MTFVEAVALQPTVITVSFSGYTYTPNDTSSWGWVVTVNGDLWPVASTSPGGSTIVELQGDSLPPNAVITVDIQSPENSVWQLLDTLVWTGPQPVTEGHFVVSVVATGPDTAAITFDGALLPGQPLDSFAGRFFIDAAPAGYTVLDYAGAVANVQVEVPFGVDNAYQTDAYGPPLFTDGRPLGDVYVPVTIP